MILTGKDGGLFNGKDGGLFFCISIIHIYIGIFQYYLELKMAIIIISIIININQTIITIIKIQ